MLRAAAFANDYQDAPSGPPSLRTLVELEIERLIALLDELDGDPDLEPSICGGIEWRSGGPRPVDDDREAGDVNDEGEPNDWDDESNGDEELSLGWPTAGGLTHLQDGWDLAVGDRED